MDFIMTRISAFINAPDKNKNPPSNGGFLDFIQTAFQAIQMK
jgi:hypothetical protein